MSPKAKMRRFLLNPLFAVMLAATPLRAGMLVCFEMESCVGYASLIVRGFLEVDGNIDSREVFKGTQPGQRLAITDGAGIYKNLLAGIHNGSRDASNTVEVVAFLERRASDTWQPVDGNAGLAGLEGTNVYLVGLGKGRFRDGRGTPVGLEKRFNRESFVAAIRVEVNFNKQQDALSAMPRSAERARMLLTFLLNHNGEYHHRRIAEALRPINSDEQREVLKAIGNTDESAAKCILLGLAADIPLSKEAFNSIAPLIARHYPAPVRRAAIWTIYRIDPPECTALLLPFITFKEPDWSTALNVLQSENPTMDVKIIAALLSLSNELRQEESRNSRQLDSNDEQAIRQQLVHHVHPKLVSFYFDWLLQNTPASPAHVASNPQAMLGVKWPPNKLETWWAERRAIIEASYDLHDDAGRQQWIFAFQGSDEVAQHVLVRLWAVTSATDQLALVRAATEGKTAAAAKSAITELWSVNQLSNEGIRAMFEAFVTVDFRDEVNTNASPFKHQHELAAVLTLGYPFHTFIHYRSPVTIDGEIIQGTTYVGGFELEPAMKNYRLGLVGGHVPGRVASGQLAIFQLDHYPNGKELWRAQWNLGPIELRE